MNNNKEMMIMENAGDKYVFPLKMPDSSKCKPMSSEEIMAFAGFDKNEYRIVDKFWNRQMESSLTRNDEGKLDEMYVPGESWLAQKNGDIWEISSRGWKNLFQGVKLRYYARSVLDKILGKEAAEELRQKVEEKNEEKRMFFLKEIQLFLMELTKMPQFAFFSADFKKEIHKYLDHTIHRHILLDDKTMNDFKDKLRVEWLKASQSCESAENKMEKILEVCRRSPLLNSLPNDIKYYDLVSLLGYSVYYTYQNIAETQKRYNSSLPNDSDLWVKIHGETNWAQVVDSYNVADGYLSFLAYEKYGTLNLRIFFREQGNKEYAYKRKYTEGESHAVMKSKSEGNFNNSNKFEKDNKRITEKARAVFLDQLSFLNSIVDSIKNIISENENSSHGKRNRAMERIKKFINVVEKSRRLERTERYIKRNDANPRQIEEKLKNLENELRVTFNKNAPDLIKGYQTDWFDRYHKAWLIVPEAVKQNNDAKEYMEQGFINIDQLIIHVREKLARYVKVMQTEKAKIDLNKIIEDVLSEI